MADRDNFESFVRFLSENKRLIPFALITAVFFGYALAGIFSGHFGIQNACESFVLCVHGNCSVVCSCC